MSTQGDGFNFFKWEGPLDLRKIVERTIAGIAASVFAGFFMGVGFWLAGGVFK